MYILFVGDGEGRNLADWLNQSCEHCKSPGHEDKMLICDNDACQKHWWVSVTLYSGGVEHERHFRAGDLPCGCQKRAEEISASWMISQQILHLQAHLLPAAQAGGAAQRGGAVVLPGMRRQVNAHRQCKGVRFLVR